MSQVDNVINELAGAANGLLSGSVSERMRLDVAVRNAIDTLLDLTDPAKFYGSELFWKLVPGKFNYAAVSKSWGVEVFIQCPHWDEMVNGWVAENSSEGHMIFMAYEHSDPAKSLIVRPGFVEKREIKVGDRVKTDYGDVCEVIGVYRDHAWLAIENSSSMWADKISDLTLIEGGE